MKKIENLIKLFPLLLLILITVNYIKLKFYYSYFRIDILKYTDLSEIPLLFFDYTIIFSFCAIITSLLITFIIKKQDEKYRISTTKLEDDLAEVNDNFNEKAKILTQAKIKIEKEQKKSAVFMKRKDWFFGIPILIYLLYSIISPLFYKNYIELIFPFGYIIIGITYMFFEKKILPLIFDDSKSDLIIILPTITILFLFVNLLSINNTIKSGYNLKYSKKEIKNISFKYKEKPIKTDSVFVFIGSTKKMTFLYNRSKKEVSYFESEKISDLKIIVD